MATSGIGLRRLQHLVLWVSDVERSVRFYRDVLGFEVKVRYPNAAFLKIPGHAGRPPSRAVRAAGSPRPHEGVARMYHSAWEVGELTDLVRARQRLIEAGSLVGSSDHGVSLSLYAKDPDGLEFEVFWTVPGGTPGRHAAAPPRGGADATRDSRPVTRARRATPSGES